MDIKRLLVISLLCLVVPCAWAQDAGEGAAEESAVVSESDLPIIDEETEVLEPQEIRAVGTLTVWDFVKMVLILGGILGFIYAICYLLKRSSGKKSVNSDLITLISSQSLGGSRGLHIVEVGNQIFLLGVAENTVQLISEITDKETIDTIRLKKSEAHLARKPFVDILGGIFKGHEVGNENSSSNFTTTFLKKQRDRLKNL